MLKDTTSTEVKAAMGRPKEFNRDEALYKALEMFWTQGFEATTVTQLRHAMGLGRQSLYDTFGDKRKLFDEALGRYIMFENQSTAKVLDQDDGLAAIEELFNMRVQMLSGGPRRGCLMVNTAVELAHHDVAAAVQVRAGFDHNQQKFEEALCRAAAAGQLRPGSDVAQLAIALTAQFSGMVILAKTGAPVTSLQAVADQAVRSLT